MIQAQVTAPKHPGKLTIGSTEIELAGDSIYYQVVANMLAQRSTGEQEGFQDMWNAKNFLSQSSMSDIAQGAANQFQLDMGRDKVVVYNYNGLSEW